MNKFIRHGRMPLLTAAALLAAAAVAFFNCASKTKTSPASAIDNAGIFTDGRDGKKYKTTVIGDKRWFAENLNYQPQSGNSWCYEDRGSNCEKYGRLYDWNTATAVCPAGWHLSSRQDWRDLLIAAGGKKKAGKALKAKRGWKTDKDDEESRGDGTDAYGFAALPGGLRLIEDDEDDLFNNVGEHGLWWTATDYDAEKAYGQAAGYDTDEVGGDSYDEEDEDGDDYGYIDAIEKGNALSVRCVQDGNVSEKERRDAERRVGDAAVSVTDSRDGRKYRVVEIGEQTWMAENLDYQPKTGDSWCYGNDKSNCAAYGRLYDWNTAKTVCPAGWHLPAAAEWDSLALEAGNYRDRNKLGSYYWENAGKRLKARSGWNAWRSVSGNGTDRYKFSALPGGHRAAEGGEFNNIGYYGYWWTATGRDSGRAAARTMDYDNGNMSEDDDDARYGFSVRCAKDESAEKAQKRKEVEARILAEEQREIEEARKIKEEEQKRLEKLSAYFNDSRDGKKYRAVEVGGKKWMAENLNYAPPNQDSRCYKNSADSCEKYGRLYNWNAAKSACPPGWHLPTREEWGELGRAAGGERKTFDNGTVDWYGAGKKLMSKTGWNICSCVSVDDYGFSAQPGGYVCAECDAEGHFDNAGRHGYWWTASERGDTAAYYHRMGYNRESGNDYDVVEYFENRENVGFSVRCVQNAK